MIEIATDGVKNADGGQSIREIGARLSAPAQLLADVSLAVSPIAAGFLAQFQALARLHIERGPAPTDDAALGTPPFPAMVSQRETVPVHAWAVDSDVGIKAMQVTLAKLAMAIVQVYPQPAAGSKSRPAAAP